MAIKNDLTNYAARQRPGKTSLTGRYVFVRPIEWAADLASLNHHLCGENTDTLWTYMGFGPFQIAADMQAALTGTAELNGWEVMSLMEASSGEVLGSASYMRIREAHGSAEIGCVLFGHQLQRTRMATEAIYLMMAHVFDDLGYRRLEWKCDARNAASRAAALRFSFSFEGIFRQDLIIKGLNRDTAWFSIIDSEWPKIKAAFQTWLGPANFCKDGQQINKLQRVTES